MRDMREGRAPGGSGYKYGENRRAWSACSSAPSSQLYLHITLGKPRSTTHRIDRSCHPPKTLTLTSPAQITSYTLIIVGIRLPRNHYLQKDRIHGKAQNRHSATQTTCRRDADQDRARQVEGSSAVGETQAETGSLEAGLTWGRSLLDLGLHRLGAGLVYLGPEALS